MMLLKERKEKTLFVAALTLIISVGMNKISETITLNGERKI